MQVLDAHAQDGSRHWPWQPITLIPIGDIQAGTVGTDWDRLQRTIDQGLEAGAYFYGMGDYTDFLSPSNRQKLKTAGLYDTAASLIEEWNEAHEERLHKVLQPTVGRWLGLLEGHHYYEYSPSDTTDTRLAHFLGCPFLGTTSVMRLSFRGDKRAVSCLIYGQHGEGVNVMGKLMKLAPDFPQIDIFMGGHDCQLYHRKMQGIEFFGPLNHLSERLRERVFISTGGYMRGYQKDSRLGRSGRANGSYIEKGMMKPANLGSPTIRIEPHMRSEYSELRIEVTE